MNNETDDRPTMNYTGRYFDDALTIASVVFLIAYL